MPTPEAFRDVMSRFATGVTVMTAVADGIPHGMTANAVASVSLDPLLVLVCVEKATVMADMVDRAGAFALSFLPAAEVELSEQFADVDRPIGAEQFAGTTVRTATSGAPILEKSLAWVDCEVWAIYDGGDHVIVVGEVRALDLGDPGDALVYFMKSYSSAAGTTLRHRRREDRED